MSITDNFPEIKTGTADAILAGLWRVILSDYDISPARLDDLVNQYSRKMTHLDANKRSQFYGNVLSDLRSDQMTWRTFKRGPMILNAKRMTMTFTLHHRFCSTEHTLHIEYGAPDELEEKLDADGNKPPTELSVFFPEIMSSLGVDVATFNRLLTSFMKRHRIDPSRSQRAYARGNLKKELLQQRLSWASMIKGLDFLTVPKFDIKITLEFENRSKKIRRSEHFSKFILNDIEDMLADMDDSDFLNPQPILEEEK